MSLSASALPDGLFWALMEWARGAAGAQVALNLSPAEIFNAEVLFREDCSPDEFIDVIVGNRVYMPCLYVSGTGPNPMPCGKGPLDPDRRQAPLRNRKSPQLSSPPSSPLYPSSYLSLTDVSHLILGF